MARRKRNLLVKHKGLKTKKVRISKPAGGDIISANNYCTVSESIQDLSSMLLENTMYKSELNIQSFPRASAMSKFFRWYRPKIVTYKYIPLYNTYAEGNGSRPEFVYVMNRTGDLVNPAGFNGMLAMGAKPQSFAKAKIIKYKPNLCQVLSVSQGATEPTNDNNYNIGFVPIYNWVQTYTGGLQKFDGPTNFDDGSAIVGLPTSNNPTWQGHNVYINTAVPVGSALIAKEYIHVIWEFKEPLSNVVSH